ncbi:MAG: Cys-tRNA(Pro) deacylase [Oscillospiraceae bacterium]|nr:Cys-tRNA(Pro) deacylase [Oscillospiraceae bacterium]
MEKHKKTNVMRLLEQAKIPYSSHEYEYTEDDPTGKHMGHEDILPREQIFKTLVARVGKGQIHVFCIPIDSELDLKKAAKVCGEKSIEMIHVRELLSLTGYMRGGCSPIGMKKKYPTVMDETAALFDEIAISAGARGCQVILSPHALRDYTGAELADITVL